MALRDQSPRKQWVREFSVCAGIDGVDDGTDVFAHCAKMLEDCRIHFVTSVVARARFGLWKGLLAFHFNPELVANEPPATGLQDLRTPHPACPVLHPAACRKLLDGTPLSADSRAHRAVRMAPHVIEKAGHGGREKRSALGASISRPDGRREQTFGRWAVSLAGGAGTAHVTPSERQKGPVARHGVCSATRGSEDLRPNRKFRLKGSPP